MDSYLVRRRIRHRWANYAGIALLLALVSGLSLFALAGARRTQSSYPRFLRAANASTLGYASNGGYDPKMIRTVASFPEVAQSRTFVGFNTFIVIPGRAPLTTRDIEGDGTFDGRYYDQDRFTATQGRIPDRNRIDEIAVDAYAAERYDLHVGQRVELDTYSTEQIEAPDAFTQPATPRLRTAATLVGIGLYPDEVLQDDGDRTPRMLLTPAFSTLARPYATYSLQGLVLKRGDRDIETVRHRIDALVPPGSIQYRVTSVDTFHAEHAMKPLSIALGVFGSIIGLTGLVLVTQALARALRTERPEQSILRALGAPPRAIIGSAVAAPALAIIGGVALGIVFAVAASPLMPIGPVRKVEVARGIDADLSVLVGVGALFALILLAGTFAIAWYNAPHRLARRRPVAGHSSRVAASAGRAGLPTPAVEGLRMALERDDTTGRATGRSVIAGSVIAIAALAGAVVFGASLNTLVHEPKLYGWNATAVLTAGQGYGNIPLDGAHRVLDHDPDVAAWSGATFGFDTIAGREVPLLGMEPGGGVYPSLLRGRPIANADEIVLGPATASELNVHVGDTVTLQGETAPHTLRVVGVATFPTVGQAHVAHPSLGVGALVATEMVPGYDRSLTGVRQPGLGPRAIFVRFQPHTNVDAELARLRVTTRPLASFAGFEVLPVQRPAEIVNSSDIGTAPLLLASALAFGAVASLGLALATTVRRRRRDLVVLKALGFTRGQLAGTLSANATTTIGIGLLFGIPIGAGLGALAWRLFADQLDVVARPTFPLAVLAAVTVAGLVVANVAALLPARAARHLDAAAVLRTD
jgi:ABC-type lipoprotein release transport system permease subunit